MSACDDTASASTETLSDLEARVEVFASRGGKYNESFDPEEGASDSQPDPEVDSEETVSDVELWESGSDNVGGAGCLRQPTQRLTARQIARQERLLQGIHQTRWDDMQLPRGLDLSHKAKQKTAVSEEQHLKKMKAAEVRRMRTQKARKDTMEITKARIRAATSNKFRDMVESNQTTKAAKVKKAEESFKKGVIRIKRRPEASFVILPPEGNIPYHLTPSKATGYPSKRIRCEAMLDSDFRMEEISVGMKMTIRSDDEKHVIMKGNVPLGNVKLTDGSVISDATGTLTSIKRHNGVPRSIHVAFDRSLSNGNYYTMSSAEMLDV